MGDMTAAEQLNNFFMWWSIAWVLVFIGMGIKRAAEWVLDKFGPEEPAPVYLGPLFFNAQFHGLVNDKRPPPSAGS